MAGGYDGSIRIDTRVDSKGFNQGISAMTGSLKGLAATIGVAFGLGAVVAFGKTAVSAASDLAAAMTGLKSVLDGTGKSFAGAKAFIDDYIKDGLVPATNAINAYKNLALRGYDDTQIQKVLVALKDSAAFGRQASLSIGQAVQGASEGLKNENSLLVDNAGVTKNVAKMWQDYARQIGTTADKLTKAQKIEAEVAGIMEETRFQTGDAAKAAGQFAGQMSALGVSFTNFKVAAGNAIIPIISKISPYVKGAIDQLTIYFNQLSQIMSTLFNVDIGSGVAGMEKTADAAQAAADAQGNLADETAKAGKAAKGSLAAFDELNVLAQPDEAAATTAVNSPAAASPVVGDPKATESALDETKKKVEEWKNKLLEFFEPLTEAFERLKEPVAELGGKIWDGLKWAWEEILVPLGEWAAREVAPRFLVWAAEGLKFLNNIIDTIKPGLKWLWEEILQPLAKWAGQAFIDWLDWATEGLKRVNKAFEEGGFWAAIKEIWKYDIEMLAGLSERANKWIEDKWDKLGDWFKEHVTEPIKKWFSQAWEDIKTWAGNAWGDIVKTWDGAGAWFQTTVTEPVKKWFSGAWEDIKGYIGSGWKKVTDTWEGAGTWIFNNVTDPIRSKFSGAWENVKGYIGDGWKKLTDTWESKGDWVESNITNPIKDKFSSSWETIKGNFGDAWEKMRSIWENKEQWFTDNVSGPIENAFSTAWGNIKTGWETTFSGLGDFLKGIVNTIIDMINGMISAMSSGINAVINAMNSLSITIPDWVPEYGGSTWGINIPLVDAPQIPRLATGAVIPPNSQFAAILGDQRSGINVESPVSLIRQTLMEALEAAGIGGGDLTITMPVYLDSEKIYEGQQKVSRRRGSSLILGGAA